MLTKTTRGAAALAVTGLLLAGCGSSSHNSPTTSPTTTAAPGTNTRGPNLRRRLPGAAHPSRIATTTRLRPSHKGPQAHLAGYEGLSLTQKLSAMANDVVHAWSPLQLPPATLNVVSDTPVTCQSSQGAVQVTTGSAPQYCLGDASLDLPAGYIAKNIEPTGDAAVLLVVSDLYGFHILNAAGAFSSSAGLTGAQILEHDACLSGIYFSLIPTTHLSAADIDAVNNELTAMSVPGSAAAANSVSAQDLTNAFNKGALALGHVKACLT